MRIADIIPATHNKLSDDSMLKGVHPLLNKYLFGRTHNVSAKKGGLYSAFLISSVSASLLSISAMAFGQAAGTANTPPPPPTVSATTPTGVQTPSSQSVPPQSTGLPQGIQMPPPPPPAPVEPTAADLKSGMNVTMPATVNVSGTAAIVNGQKITMQQLVAAFIRGGGAPMLQEMITRIELEQAAAKEHVTVTPSEIEAKLAASKRELLERGSGGQTWAQMLASRGLSEDYARNQIYIALLAEKLATAHQPYSLHGQVHIYHILLATTQLPFGRSPHSDADAKKQIESIASDISYHKITFQQAAAKYSDDQSTAVKGGDLGWVSESDGLDENFKTAAFALKEGEISGPVKSQFGWHLIYAAKFGEHATAAEVTKASDDTLDQRSRPVMQQYMAALQGSANVEDFLIPLPAKPKTNPGLGGPQRIPSAPLRVPVGTGGTNPGTSKSGSTPPPPPL